MVDQEVSLSKKSIVLIVLSCVFVLLLLRSSRNTSNSIEEIIQPVKEKQQSDSSQLVTDSPPLSEPAPVVDSPVPQPQEKENKDLYLIPPSQEWIQRQFDKALSELDLEYSPASLWSTCGSKTYYFPKINTIFTGIPKTGCSNWIEALLRAEGDLTKELDPTMIRKVHGAISGRHRMPTMSLTYDDETLRKAFSFTVLRNPWTRMVSGYRDKLSDEDTQGGAKRTIGVAIVQEMRGIDKNLVKNKELYPTFAEYALWLVKHGGNINVHFSPQIKTLCIPKSKYDIVVPLEYNGVVGPEVLNRIGASSSSVLGSYDKSSDPRLQKSTLYAKKWLSELEPALVERLYTIFKTDFTLLNYSNFTHPDFPLPLYNDE